MCSDNYTLILTPPTQPVLKQFFINSNSSKIMVINVIFFLSILSKSYVLIILIKFFETFSNSLIVVSTNWALSFFSVIFPFFVELLFLVW